jgi:YgiT-type zinc finger domain-containing protein
LHVLVADDPDGAHYVITVYEPSAETMGSRRPHTQGAAMTCPICGQGLLSPGTTTFAADAEGTVVVVRNVPADVCENCGEAFISDAIAATLEDLVANAKESGTESLVRHYQPLAS